MASVSRVCPLVLSAEGDACGSCAHWSMDVGVTGRLTRLWMKWVWHVILDVSPPHQESGRPATTAVPPRRVQHEAPFPTVSVINASWKHQHLNHPPTRNPLDRYRTHVLFWHQAVPMRERAGLGSATTPRPAGYRSSTLGAGPRLCRAPRSIPPLFRVASRQTHWTLDPGLSSCSGIFAGSGDSVLSSPVASESIVSL